MNRLRLTRPLLVRQARLDDAADLHSTCFPDQPLQWVADYLAWCLEAPDRPARLVALLRGHLVAQMELTRRQNGEWAEISNFIVSEALRRQGIGWRVAGAAVRTAQRWGCREVRLQVQLPNEELTEMYRHWGFHPLGTPLNGRQWFTLPIARENPPVQEPPQPRAPRLRLGTSESNEVSVDR